MPQRSSKRKEEKGILIAEVICPLSGMILSGKKIKAHYLDLVTCTNGTLYARCIYHGIRVFVNERMVVKEIKESVYAEKEAEA